MLKTTLFALPLAILFLFCFFGIGQTADMMHLFRQVEKLKIERNGYLLGAVLTPSQMATAAAFPVDATAKNTFKFHDKNLYIVAHKPSNRVLVLYEKIEQATREKIQDLMGDLYLNFDAPTVMAHDKVVYWAYGETGKISSETFDAAKNESKKLDILATVKCISDVSIMEKTENPEIGTVYYIISSDPILRFFEEQ
jgi:hypothetical protein